LHFFFTFGFIFWSYAWQKPNEMFYRADIGGFVPDPLPGQTVQFQQIYRITE